MLTDWQRTILWAAFPALRAALQAELRACMLDASRRAAEIMGDAGRAASAGVQWQALLALRGLLAGGILLHCMQQRHGVQYGIRR